MSTIQVWPTAQDGRNKTEAKILIENAQRQLALLRRARGAA